MSRPVGCSRGLLAAGICRGHRVAVWPTNCVDWVVTQFGTSLIGAVLATVNSAYRLHELEFVLRSSRARALVLGQGFRDAFHPDLL